MEKVLCIGEALIDFICSDINSNLVEGQNFLKKAGGAPANVAAAITKLGGKASFIGKVGKDAFGSFLINEMQKYNIDCSSVVCDENKSTTLAFVSIKGNGERDFEFFRGADGELKFDELEKNELDLSNIYHFGSATALLDGHLFETYMKLIKYAKNNNKLVSFDPNFRKLLWMGKEKVFVERVKECLKYVDFIKMSDEEAELLFETNSYEEISKTVHTYGVKVLAITCGKDGTYLSVNSTNSINTKVKSISIKSLDSTGAGDAFVGGVLYKLSNSKLFRDDIYNIDIMKKYTEFGNITGALTCCKFGAMEAIPELTSINKYYTE